MIFKSRRIINLSHKIKIYGIDFYSGSFSITQINNNINECEYLLNFRMINYEIINNCYKANVMINTNKIFISVNQMIKFDKNFKIIDENKIIIPPLLKNISKGINVYNKNIIGIEDMRIFNFNNEIKIIGTAEDTNNKSNIVSGNYDYITNTLSNINFIENTFNNQEVEKNWVYFLNDIDQLNIIYKWYPLQICSMDNNKLILLKNIDMPIYFKNIRGSTCGLKYNNQNWFIVHLNEEGYYYHLFVVFDMKMKLIKYSNKFKFEGYRIEFCIGFTIFDSNNLIICYSLDDTISKLAIYDIKRLNELKWGS